MQVCCFTGHRENKLDLDNQELVELNIKLKQVIQNLINKGVTVFLTGMATGIDTMCAKIVLELKNEQDLSLYAIIPCLNQSEKWTKEQKQQYQEILSKVDNKKIISKIHTKTCMHDRNRFMVDKSDYVIAVYNGKKGGTKYTIDYANKTNKQLIQINI